MAPDHRHRCYAKEPPEPRAYAHQEAYCLTADHPVCPFFQEWAEGHIAGRVLETASPIRAPLGQLAAFDLVADEAELKSRWLPRAAREPVGAAVASAAGPDDRGSAAAGDRGAAAGVDDVTPPSIPLPRSAGTGAAPGDAPPDRSARSAFIQGSADGGLRDVLSGGWRRDARERASYRVGPAVLDDAEEGEMLEGGQREQRDLGGLLNWGGRRASPPEPTGGAAGVRVGIRAGQRHRPPPGIRAAAAIDSVRRTRPSFRPTQRERYATGRRDARPAPVPPMLLAIVALAFGVVALFMLPGLLSRRAETPQGGATRAPAARQPAAQAPASATAAPRPRGSVLPTRVYRVARGDSLGKIAQRFKLTTKQLLAANPKIKNANRINVGDVILIPTGATAP